MRHRRDWYVSVVLFASTVLTLHFVGMSSVTVVLDARGLASANALSRHSLEVGTTAAALSVIMITLFGASIDKRLSRRLVVEVARFRTLADSAFEGLIISRNGQVIDSNVAARQLLMMESGDTVRLATLFPDGQAPAADTEHLETEMLRRDGVRVPVEVHRRPILASDDSAAELLAIRDLTAKFEAERELQAALQDVSRLRDLIPMCAWCKKVRNDSGFWRSVDDYLSKVTGQDITHGVCPECFDKMMKGIANRPA